MIPCGVTAPEIVKEGWLYKRGTTFKTWSKRYFILQDDGAFLGFKKRPEPEQLSKPRNVYSVDGSQTFCQEKPRRFSFVFRCLRPMEQIERYFSLRSDDERAEWVS